MGQIVKFGYNTGRFHHRVVPEPYLVEQAPYENRGMIVVLAYKFGELCLEIFGKFRRIGAVAHKRDFCPHEHTVVVAQVVELFRMRIMGQADGVCPLSL